MIDESTLGQAAAAVIPPAVGERVWPLASLVRARAGRVLVGLSDVMGDVYLVLAGRLRVTVFSDSGREVVLRDLRAGALFGELGALDGQPRSASVAAVEDCRLASIPAAAFRAAVAATPDGAEWMMRRLVAQIRELSERVFELNTLRVPNRLHCELLRLCLDTPGGVVDGRIDAFPTHAELAARIGTHREAVTRELGFLVEQQVVRLSGRRSAVVDVDRLNALVTRAGGAAAADRSRWPGTDHDG